MHGQNLFKLTLTVLTNTITYSYKSVQ